MVMSFYDSKKRNKKKMLGVSSQVRPPLFIRLGHAMGYFMQFGISSRIDEIMRKFLTSLHEMLRKNLKKKKLTRNEKCRQF
jgi:hypothetical protein